MKFAPPHSLTPSKLDAFKSCPLAFRYSVIDRLPQETSEAQIVGTFTHRALELLFANPAGRRTRARAATAVGEAYAEAREDPDFAALDHPAQMRVVTRCEDMLNGYFALEDPNEVRLVATELVVEARVGGVLLRGILDRIETDASGGLIVVDYKTGRAPREDREGQKLTGVMFYAALCESVLGRLPVEVRLLHLAEPVSISVQPTSQSVRGLHQRASAVWKAVMRSCATGNFAPRPSRLCDWCSFQQFCPAFGGEDPKIRAAAESTAAQAAEPQQQSLV